MMKATRRKAPDERAATPPDPNTPPSSFSQLGPTRTTSTPPRPTRGEYETQTSLPVKPAKTNSGDLELSCPQPTTLEENVKQYSPSASNTSQNLPHTKRTTPTGSNRQPQRACNHTRKRPHITFSPTPVSEATGDIASTETQQYTVNPEIPHAPKRTKSSHPHSPTTKTPKQRVPTNDPPRKRTPKLGRHGHPQHLYTGPRTKHIIPPPHLPTPPPNTTTTTQPQ